MHFTSKRSEGKQSGCGGRAKFGLLLFVFCLVTAQKGQADSIFDKVTQPKNSSKANAGSSSPTSVPSGSTYSTLGQTGSPYSTSAPTGSTYPASGQAGSAYSAPAPVGSTVPSSPPSAVPYTSSTPAGTTYPTPAPAVTPDSTLAPSATTSPPTGLEETTYPANANRAASGLKNVVNSGIQNNLQRGLNQGAGALDRLGRKVGLPGIGSLLGAPNAMPNAGGGAFNSHPTAWTPYNRAGRESQESVYLRSAQQAEARGDWNQAAYAYRQAAGGYHPTPEDEAAATRNHTDAQTEMMKRKSTDPSFRQLNIKWAHCAVQLLNQDYAGQKTNVDVKYTEDELLSAYESLQESDKGNGAWPYLIAVYWCSEFKHPTPSGLGTMWNYLKAESYLKEALFIQGISPSVRQKCINLSKHISTAVNLQNYDRERAIFSMKQDIVWNAEHPHIAATETTQSRTSYDDTHDKVTTYTRQALNTEFWAVEKYDECKKSLQATYPKFKTMWLNELTGLMGYPNRGAAVPPGPANEEPAQCCPARWEQLAFGPLDLTIGRQYPRSVNVVGAGHHDRDLLPAAYVNAMNGKIRGK